ncbi:hypothetical protein HDF16_004475 [Granulicella aggregans]|uniref:Uncharacterized protein n=1 Tax=Granulicella aggregans TaxID=474949 RepID=A0A7W8E5K9_9BACT|nr:hypothetical protein [Granulicella aggregans]MBB5059746.1 hypothetical protein [Granulicella aggregans]
MADVAVALSIDVLHDLESASSLKSLLSSSKDVLFNLGSEVAKFATQPVKDAAAAKPSAQLTLTAPASWTLPNGIVFSLSGSASCAISIDTASETFSVATTLDSDATTDIVAGPTAGIAYINIDLDFSIQASASGSGTVSGIGIAGTASGGRSATLSFCQPVSDSLNTLEAVKQAFSQIVFPLDPTRIADMQTGALTRVLFDGTFNAELDVTYGLGDHLFAAPGVASALASAEKVVSLTPPSVEINAGVTGSVTYTHTDHFALVIDKSTATVATAYLIRVLASDAGLNAALNVGVTTTNVSVAVDQGALQAVVKDVTKSDLLATAVVKAASTPLNNLVTSLNARLAKWAAEVTGEIGLSAGLASHKNRTALFVFDCDLTSPALTTASWSALISGDIIKAVNAGGLKLQSGSGVSESLKRSATINFQFFNLFSFNNVTDFFSNATAELGPDGTIRFHASIGDESKSTTKTSFSAFRIYFVVAASSDAAGHVSTSEVDLRLELSEANRTKKGSSFADTLSLSAPASAITDAQKALATYLGGHPTGGVTLIYNIKPSIYSKLAFSAFAANKPAPLPQADDQANWSAFHGATSSLVPDLAFVSALTYPVWMDYNRASIDQPGSTIVPDRRHVGNPAAGLAILASSATRDLQGFFLQASQGFMNLCEDLSILANKSTAVTDLASYNTMLGFITNITTNDVFLDYAIPTAGALLHQCSNAGAQLASVVDLPSDASSVTCTLTLS